MWKHHAVEMIKKNKRSLDTLKNIAARNPDLELERGIRWREKMQAEHRDPSRFKGNLYFEGARDASPAEIASAIAGNYHRGVEAVIFRNFGERGVKRVAKAFQASFGGRSDALPR